MLAYTLEDFRPPYTERESLSVTQSMMQMNLIATWKTETVGMEIGNTQKGCSSNPCLIRVLGFDFESRDVR